MRELLEDNALHAWASKVTENDEFFKQATEDAKRAFWNVPLKAGDERWMKEVLNDTSIVKGEDVHKTFGAGAMMGFETGLLGVCETFAHGYERGQTMALEWMKENAALIDWKSVVKIPQVKNFVVNSDKTVSKKEVWAVVSGYQLKNWLTVALLGEAKLKNVIKLVNLAMKNGWKWTDLPKELWGRVAFLCVANDSRNFDGGWIFECWKRHLPEALTRVEKITRTKDGVYPMLSGLVGEFEQTMFRTTVKWSQDTQSSNLAVRFWLNNLNLISAKDKRWVKELSARRNFTTAMRELVAVVERETLRKKLNVVKTAQARQINTIL
jgi:hypothetical protein